MTTNKLTFRKATPADVTAILPLVRKAYRGEESRAGWTTEADLVADERIDEAGILAKINEPHGAVLLSHDEAGVLISCCEILRREDGQRAYFGMFAVDPKRQGGGVGRQVLERAELYARDAWGIHTMEMSVIWVREELISWYVRRGYERTGKKSPFPYEHLINGSALRDDLYFDVLEKKI